MHEEKKTYYDEDEYEEVDEKFNCITHSLSLSLFLSSPFMFYA